MTIKVHTNSCLAAWAEVAAEPTLNRAAQQRYAGPHSQSAGQTNDKHVLRYMHHSLACRRPVQSHAPCHSPSDTTAAPRPFGAPGSCWATSPDVPTACASPINRLLYGLPCKSTTSQALSFRGGTVGAGARHRRPTTQPHPVILPGQPRQPDPLLTQYTRAVGLASCTNIPPLPARACHHASC